MRLQERVKMVKEAFNPAVLAEICMAPESYFEKYGTTFHENDGKGKFAFYCKDDVSDILAIAHLDSVQKPSDFGFAKYVSGKEIILSPTLDDRLGAYVICELLPALGIKTDILLTTDEERGNSSARLFSTTKKYKWMFQFDRAGNDVVMYQYDCKELRDKLVDCGFKPAMGSASDISKLGDLGCLGMNFGVGYEDYHFQRAWADLDVLFEQVAKFMKFHHKYEHEFMAYERKIVKVESWSGGHPAMGSYGFHGANENYETEYGARRDGIWYGNMVYDETRHMEVPNLYLYKHYPSVKVPTVHRILRANETWDPIKGKFVMKNGHSEKEILKVAQEILNEAGHGAFPLPLAALEEHKDENKRMEIKPSEGSIDDPCFCSHSRFVHHRSKMVKGRMIASACDFWKCNCDGFENAILTHRPDNPKVDA